jgi:hypothetical protein
MGSIFFAFNDRPVWERCPDKDRWTLNFYHWMLGLDVPEAASTEIE